MNSGDRVLAYRPWTEPVRRERPTAPCDAITWMGHVPRGIGRDRGPVGSLRRMRLRSERQYRDRRRLRRFDLRRGGRMSDQARWYAGVDWGSENHCVFLTDGEGRKIGERTFAHE